MTEIVKVQGLQKKLWQVCRIKRCQFHVGTRSGSGFSRT